MAITAISTIALTILVITDLRLSDLRYFSRSNSTALTVDGSNVAMNVSFTVVRTMRAQWVSEGTIVIIQKMQKAARHTTMPCRSLYLCKLLTFANRQLLQHSQRGVCRQPLVLQLLQSAVLLQGVNSLGYLSGELGALRQENTHAFLILRIGNLTQNLTSLASLTMFTAVGVSTTRTSI